MSRRQEYKVETQGVEVRVRPTYLESQSDPDGGRWLWAYRVTIRNRRTDVVQLVARRWIITDAGGRTEEVRGPGVVGETPVIGPGDSYEYASGCPLGTPSGSMRGSYQMADAQGRAFQVEIPHFSLDVPGARRTLN